MEPILRKNARMQSVRAQAASRRRGKGASFLGYFDLHCDTITECFARGEGLAENGLHWSLRRAEGLAPLAQVFAVWMPDDFRGEAAVKRFDDVAAVFFSEMEKNAGAISFCKTAAELKAALDGGRAAALLSIEGGAALGGRLENLDRAYKTGVRLLTLTWNGRCELGDGVMEPEARGLTAFGRQAVRRMEELRMAVDVSHLSERGFWEVAELCARPFLASHSNAKAVCGHPRNLTDEQFCEIARRGGLVGLNLYRRFLRDDGDAGFSDVLRHAEHFLALGGERTLALGGDLDGSALPACMRGVEDMPRLREELLRRLPEATVEDFFFGNARRFFEKILEPGEISSESGKKEFNILL